MLEKIRRCLIDRKSLKLGLKEEIDFEHGEKILCEKNSINKSQKQRIMGIFENSDQKIQALNEEKVKDEVKNMIAMAR